MPRSLTSRQLPRLLGRQGFPESRHALPMALMLGMLTMLGLAGCQRGSLPSEPEAGAPVLPRPAFSGGTDQSPWRVKAPMPTARTGLVAATVNGVVYTIAGHTASGAVAKVEAYCDGCGLFDGWLSRAPLPAKRVGRAARP